MAAEAIRAESIARAMPELRRSMGLASVALFLVVACSNLQWIGTAAHAGPSTLVLWVLGCAAMFVPLSIVVVALASRYPEEGGMYVWAKIALGPFAGFITAWTYWTANLPYFAALLYFMAGNAVYIGGRGGEALLSSPAYFIVVSVAGLTVATVLNVFGLDVAKWLNNVGAVSRWTVTLLLIGLGAFAWWKFGSVTAIDAASVRPGVNLKDIIFFSIIAFAWTGPEAAPLMAGEVKNPRRTIPLGLALAAPAIAVIYIAGTAAVMAVVPPASVNSTSAVVQAIGAVANRSGLAVIVPIAALLVTASCLGSVGAWIGATARLPFVAGIDRYLPAAFGKIDPRWGSPVVAIVAQSAIAVVFIVLGQAGSVVKDAYQTLIDATVLLTLIPFVFIFVAALVVFRKHADSAQLPVVGSRALVLVASVVGLATTVFAIAFGVFPADDTVDKAGSVIRVFVITLLVIGTGVVVYLRGAAQRAEPAAGA